MRLIILSIITILFAGIGYAQNLETQLGEAANAGDLKKVKKLVEKKGARVNCILHINGVIQIPLLVKMVMEEKTEIATYLIEKGANINVTDGFGMTSLMWAANNGDLKLVKLLLDNGADKNIESKGGLTALKGAQEKGHTEIIELLK